MEQPPGNSDGLQPQELASTCSLPSVFDLTRNGEECLLKANPIEALHVVQPPSWYVSSGTSNGMVLPADDPNPLPQPSDQIQLDNAFSNTTVTLSYVSRSHVFSSPNSLLEHPQLYGVPLSKTFSLPPAAYNAGQLVTDTSGAPLCVEMDQHCLQQVSVPVGLAACANSFEFVTPAQVVENVAGLCYLQQAHDLSGIQDAESLALEALKSLQQSNLNECKIPISLDEMQNGGVSGLWDACAFDGSFPAGHIANADVQQRNGNPEVLFLISRSEEPVILQNSQAPASLAVSLNQDFISTLEDPVSPPVASLDEIKDVFFVPQTARSPSEQVNSFIETNNIGQGELDKGETDPTTSIEETDSSCVTEVASGFHTSTSSQLTGSTVDTCTPEQTEQSSDLSEGREEKAKRRTLANRKTQVSSGLAAKKETLLRKLPPRSRRGKRLEAIVQNIRPIRYRSSHASSTKKSQGVNSQAVDATHLGSEQDVSFDSSSQDVLEEAPTPLTSEPYEKTAQSQEKEEEAAGVADLNCSESRLSTSCSESVSKCWPERTPETLLKPIKRGKKSKKRPRVSNKCQVRVRPQTAPPAQGLCARSPSKQKALHKSNKGSPRAKKVHTPKRKRKKHKGGQGSVFSPQEPEIKLKYANYKEDRKEKRDETFSPFVHVEMKTYPSCTVVNYPEESERLNRGKEQVHSRFASGAVPTTPCLQYGRVSTEADQRGALVCCLCGGSANAMDLGDLHGPYYPDGFRPVSKTPVNTQEIKEDDSSDTDSSHVANGNLHATPIKTSWTRKGHRKLREAAGLGTFQGWSSEGDFSCSPAHKRSRMDMITDWYSPPIVPLEASEYWFHEDCGIWSAGVFLVRGKLFGLEKAVKIAKETVSFHACIVKTCFYLKF